MLIFAVAYSRLNFVKELLERGSDVNRECLFSVMCDVFGQSFFPVIDMGRPYFGSDNLVQVYHVSPLEAARLDLEKHPPSDSDSPDVREQILELLEAYNPVQ